MKPIRLELREFGPYKHEVIQWNEIINEPMFLITGKTGSGKSTLFDAFVYALYNKTTSGKDIASLRTKTADDKDRTIVIFDFELQGKHYRIERTLAYLKTGNKNITSGKVCLMEINAGIETILATKENDVKEKVEQIIGLDDKQFCQIIILPQGKFKEFLLSNSNEKKEVLRSLFNTHFYQKFVDKLQNYAKTLDSNYKLKERELVTKFEQFNFEKDFPKIEFLKESDFEEVEKQLVFQKNEVNELEKHQKYLEDELTKLKIEYSELDKLNDKFNNLEENNDSHKKLLEDAQRITHLKNVVKQLEELGKNKDKLLDYDNYLDKKEQLIKNKETLSKEQNILGKKIQENKKLGEEILTQNDSINDIREEIARYNYFYENIEFFYQAEKDIAFYSEKLKNIEDTKGAIEQLEKEVTDYNVNLEEYKEELNILENSIGKLKLDILKKETEAEKLEDFRNLENTIKSKAADLKEKQTELSLANSRQKELEQKILELEKNKQQEILNTFLVHLHEGDCCPLCQQKIKKLPAVKQVIKIENEDAKNELDDIIKNIIRLETLVVKEKEDLSILQEELASKKIEINFSAKEELEQFVVEKKNEDNERKITFEKIEKVSNCRNELAEKLEKLNSLISFESEYKEKLVIAQAKKQQYTENIDISLDEFKQYYEKQKQIILSYDEKQEFYQKVKTNLMLKEKELIVELKNSNKNILEVEKTIENIIEKFKDSKLKLYYNSLKIAKDDLVKLDDIESYKNEIQVYEDRLKIILDNIQRLEEELQNKERPNLVEYAQKLLKKEQEMMDCAEEVTISKTKFKSNTNLFENLSKEFTILEKNISTAREVFALSNVISGKTESKKSLETYVQGYYLDLILEAGTKRLLQMTDERYRFERKIEKAKGGGLQGLDIEIYDVYLNSSRMVSSLSGGEIFLASLSLALGLAEVIQNESGGISLETIFIDEGFGSLDAETLDTAITTLIELQSYGRNIGIISHVSELKERIRPKLEVYSKNNYAKVKISGV